MSLLGVLERATTSLDGCVQALGQSMPMPVRVKVGDRFVFRHERQDDVLLSYLKAVRLTSAHNASIALMRAGFPVETYALCRMADEAAEDIWFMLRPLGDSDEASKDQHRFIEEFFQEEFEDPDDLLSPASRDRVPRRRIHAALTRLPGAESTNPSDDLAAAQSLHKVFSGGAYVHIMEMFGGNPPRFHTSGMLGTPRMDECEKNHANYLYRSLLAVEIFARRLEQTDIEKRLCAAAIELARATGCVKPEEIARMERRLDRTPDEGGDAAEPAVRGM